MYPSSKHTSKVCENMLTIKHCAQFWLLFPWAQARYDTSKTNRLLSGLKVSRLLEKHYKVQFSIRLYYTFLHYSVLWPIFSSVLRACSIKVKISFLLNLICVTHFVLFIRLKAFSLKKLYFSCWNPILTLVILFKLACCSAYDQS